MGFYRDNEEKMETTRVPLKGDIGVALGFYNKDNENENGDHYSILGLYRDNGKENGNYHIITGLYPETLLLKSGEKLP